RALKSVHKYDCEIIYCDDGSTDDTQLVIRELAGKDKRVRLLRLTRNFGKEMATTAGLRLARGEAVITIDGDGQHPAVLITELINAWEDGAKVVVGRRLVDAHDGFVKAIGSRL